MFNHMCKSTHSPLNPTNFQICFKYILLVYSKAGYIYFLWNEKI